MGNTYKPNQIEFINTKSKERRRRGGEKRKHCKIKIKIANSSKKIIKY